MTRPKRYPSEERITVKIDTSHTKVNKPIEDTTMTNTRRIVTVQLIDQDKGLPVEDSVVAIFKDVVTEDTDSVTVQEILMKKDIKSKLADHNELREHTVDTSILDRTGNKVYLRPVKLKDLTWVVR